MPIYDAKNRLLSANSGTVPNVSGALHGWMQPMTFTRVTTTIVDFQAREVGVDFSFMGVWQPFTAKQLQILPEKERSRSWFTLHAELGVVLDTDEVVKYLGIQYRVMEKIDYTIYGYVEYHLVQDDTGAGPEIE